MPGHGHGTLTDGSGSGWKALDLRGTCTPVARSGMAAHALSFGYHHDNYFLDSVMYNMAAWRDGPGVGFANSFGGRTSTQAA